MFLAVTALPDRTVQPRVGGEQVITQAGRYPGFGSAPRGRGTVFQAVPDDAVIRFSPAWAGNRSSPPPARRLGPVQPRVGGEQTASRPTRASSPGSAPRGRGTERLHEGAVRRPRFSPAWAGNSRASSSATPLTSVQPRVGGEQLGVSSRVVPGRGSAPRGRGTAGPARLHAQARRFSPAWAGNRSRWTPTRRCNPVQPRVGGEQVFRLFRSRTSDGSAPRGRGTVETGLRAILGGRFSPAWAGNSHVGHASPALAAVQPRVGGEQVICPPGRRTGTGSAPRGRGTDVLVDRHAMRRRFSPAWAGNSHRSKMLIKLWIHDVKKSTGVLLLFGDC